MTASEELASWRIATTSLLVKSPTFPAKIQEKVAHLAEQLDSLLSPIASQMFKPNVRLRKLRAHLQLAADLAIEFSMEPSLFVFYQIPPGDLCNNFTMTDVIGLLPEGEMDGVTNGNTVELMVYPLVKRVPMGMEDLSQGVVIAKAKVLVKKQVVVEAMNSLEGEDKEEVPREWKELEFPGAWKQDEVTGVWNQDEGVCLGDAMVNLNLQQQEIVDGENVNVQQHEQQLEVVDVGNMNVQQQQQQQQLEVVDRENMNVQQQQQQQQQQQEVGMPIQDVRTEPDNTPSSDCIESPLAISNCIEVPLVKDIDMTDAV